MISIAVDVTHRNQIAAALAEASAREKAILASIPDIIVEVNNNKEYTWSNRAGYDFFGDELLGKKAEYYFEGEQEPYDLANPLFGKDDSVIYVENWQRRRDGEKRLLAWWRQALKDTDGHVIGALSTARDITDRKRTEEQLRAAHDELEARVAERTTELLGANTSLRREIADREHAEESARLAAAMMNHMADGVQLTRAETGEIVFANPRFEEMFGYGPGELNGKPVSILNAPSEKSPEDTAAEIIQSLGQTGKWSGEVCNIRKNGEHFWCAAAVSTFDHATHGTVWVAVHQDVTERKRAEEALRRTQLAVDHSSEAILRVHEDGHISYVNRSACSRLGYSNAELVMMSIPDISPNYTHEEWPAHWEELKRAGTLIFEARHQRKNGNVFPVEVTTNHHVHEGQEYVWAHVRDITERKRIEEQLRTREAELAHATRLSTIGATVAGLAHELSQPLSAVSTYADACTRMVESGSDDKLVETLVKVAHQAERAGKIVHRVQRFIRKEASLRSPVDLNALIRETLELVDPEGRFDGVSISLKLDDSLPPILADAIQIQQVVVNLVRNAVESMEQIDTRHRTITIQSNAPVDDMVIVTVCDTGTGLEPDAADRLFEAFFTTKSNGMGLGLSVSQTIIQAHGGQLWATQNSDSGTTFHLSLPIERRTTDDNR